MGEFGRLSPLSCEQKQVCEDGMEEDAILCAHECSIHCNIVDDFFEIPSVFV